MSTSGFGDGCLHYLSGSYMCACPEKQQWVEAGHRLVSGIVWEDFRGALSSFSRGRWVLDYKDGKANLWHPERQVFGELLQGSVMPLASFYSERLGSNVYHVRMIEREYGTTVGD